MTASSAMCNFEYVPLFSKYIVTFDFFQAYIVTGYFVHKHVSLKSRKHRIFLSHIETKSDLTTYLAEYCVKELKKNKKLIVVYKTSCVANIENYPPDLEYHNHEEADTLIMLQAKNVADMCPYCEIDYHQTLMCFYLPFTFTESCLQSYYFGREML